MFAAHRLVKIHPPVMFHEEILYGSGIMAPTRIFGKDRKLAESKTPKVVFLVRDTSTRQVVESSGKNTKHSLKIDITINILFSCIY